MICGTARGAPLRIPPGRDGEGPIGGGFLMRTVSEIKSPAIYPSLFNAVGRQSGQNKKLTGQTIKRSKRLGVSP
jgi:hypothetical protein